MDIHSDDSQEYEEEKEEQDNISDKNYDPKG